MNYFLGQQGLPRIHLGLVYSHSAKFLTNVKA